MFKCQKYVKKGYMEMTKNNYLEPFKKCLGSLGFTLLEICSKLKIKIPKRHRRRSRIFIVNFEDISQLVLVFLL